MLPPSFLLLRFCSDLHFNIQQNPHWLYYNETQEWGLAVSPLCRDLWNSDQILSWLQNPTAPPRETTLTVTAIVECRLEVTLIAVPVFRLWADSPCVTVDRRRSWTSLGQSACIWTQAALGGTDSRCCDRSDTINRTDYPYEFLNTWSSEVNYEERNANGFLKGGCERSEKRTGQTWKVTGHF